MIRTTDREEQSHTSVVLVITVLSLIRAVGAVINVYHPISASICKCETYVHCTP